MDKYAILAKGLEDYNAGHGKYGKGTPFTQTECATELIVNRLDLINSLHNNTVDKTTVIITLEERKFLYENIFHTVLSNSEISKNIVDFSTAEGGGDLQLDKSKKIRDYTNVQFFYNMVKRNEGYFRDKYNFYERDKETINNIKYNDDILNTEMDYFLVCIPRLKNSDMGRNLEQDYWAKFINVAKDKFAKVIVFGKGNDNLQGDNVLYVDTLQDYCSYLHHPKCQHVVSTISGPCHYVQHFGNTGGNTKLTMIDNHNLTSKYGNSPSYFNPCINFTNVQLNIIKHVPEEKELLDLVRGV